LENFLKTDKEKVVQKGFYDRKQGILENDDE
jgi:hypothetical protein